MTVWNDLILAQEEMVWFHIVEESKVESNTYGYVIQTWMKLLIETRLSKKFAKFKLDDATRNPEEWGTKIELLR